MCRNHTGWLASFGGALGERPAGTCPWAPSSRSGRSSTMAAVRPRWLLILVLLLLALSAPGSASAAMPVSYPAVLQQVRSGPLARAVINRANRHVEIKF